MNFKNFFLCTLTIGVGSLFFVGCSNEPDEPDLPPLGIADPITLDAAQTRALQASNNFALQLAEAVQETRQYLNPNGNLLISPLSALACLSMLANGADEETLSEMVSALGENGVASLEDLNSLNARLYDALLNVDKSSNITLANSLWVAKNDGISQQFRNAIAEHYNGELYEKDDLSSTSTASSMLKWAQEKSGMQPIITDGNNFPIVLLSAVAFEGKWATPFLADATGSAYFHHADRPASFVDMMKSPVISGLYMENESLLAFELPYGNHAFSMVVILPSKYEGGIRLKELFSEVSYDRIINGISFNGTMDVEMPRFNMSYHFMADEEMMAECGMPGAFTDKANFSKLGVTDKSATLNQYAVINVDESGTKVASTTTNKSPVLTALPHKSIKCDHPFAFVIKENSTGAILFIGVVNKL